MSLVKTAEQFSHFCRTGVLDPQLQLNPRRARIYFKHVKQGIVSALERAYPLTRHLLKPKRWETLMTAFLAEVDCATPFLWRMPQLLVDFVKQNEWSERFKIPYLNDLVDFEWLEIEVYMMPDCPQKNWRREGSLLEEPLIINPESYLTAYAYPVFEKKKLPRPMKRGHYPLLSFRHPETNQVHFIALSPFFRTVLEGIKVQMTGFQALMSAAKIFNLKESAVLAAGEKFLEDMLDQYVIYGFK